MFETEVDEFVQFGADYQTSSFSLSNRSARQTCRIVWPWQRHWLHSVIVYFQLRFLFCQAPFSLTFDLICCLHLSKRRGGGKLVLCHNHVLSPQVQLGKTTDTHHCYLLSPKHGQPELCHYNPAVNISTVAK